MEVGDYSLVFGRWNIRRLHICRTSENSTGNEKTDYLQLKSLIHETLT